MTESQYYTLLALAIAAIVMNALLFLYLTARAGRADVKLAALDSRVAALEARKTRS
jgi:hypothetical protein